MTTRQQFREALRRRLEDTTLTPLWDDAILDDAVASAVREFGVRFPSQRSATVTVFAGAMTIVVPEITDRRGRVVRLFDGGGELVARSWAIPGDLPALHPREQAWRWWDGALRLDRPAQAGTWTVEYLAAAVPPTADDGVIEVAPADEPLLENMAALYALHHRAIAEGKRGQSPAPIVRAAADLRQLMNGQLRARMRLARGAA